MRTEQVKSTAKVGAQIMFSVHEKTRTVNTSAWCIDSGADTNIMIFPADWSSVKAGIGEGYLACRISDNRVQIIKFKNVIYPTT